MSDTIFSILRRQEQQFIYGTTTMGKYVQWSMHDTIETIDAYLNSKHKSGSKDSIGREKPFFNIVSAVANIWFRSTDIDRKNIKFFSSDSSSVLLAFVASVLLHNWMRKERFGVFLNEWGRALAKYGSAVSKWVEKDGKLHVHVVAWNRLIVDSVDFDASPKIEKFYLTPDQLIRAATPGDEKYQGYNLDQAKALIQAQTSRRTLDKQRQDTMQGPEGFIELYEIHGAMPDSFLDDNNETPDGDEPTKYTQQMHVVSYVEEKTDEYIDFSLYKAEEKSDPYRIDHLIREDGRTLAIGAVEYLFDAQWMANHTMKNWKDQLDIASRLIFQTADQNFVNRNVLSAIESGDILIHQKEMPLELVPNAGHDVTNLEAFWAQWKSVTEDITSTPPALRGQLGGGRQAAALQSMLAQQAGSLFELMTENKGLAIEDMMREHVIPHIKKQLNHGDEIQAILDDAAVSQIDSMYLPSAAAKRFNKRTIDNVLNKKHSLANPAPQFNPQAEQQDIKTQLASLGNTRFFKPDEVGSQTWKKLLEYFDWDNIIVDVTGEDIDSKEVMQTLSMVLQTVAGNPAILQEPNAKMLFSKILTATGIVSPLEVSAASSQPAPAAAAPQQVPGKPQPPQTPRIGGSNLPAPVQK